MIAAWNIFIFAILVLVLIGFALTKVPVVAAVTSYAARAAH